MKRGSTRILPWLPVGLLALGLLVFLTLRTEPASRLQSKLPNQPVPTESFDTPRSPSTTPRESANANAPRGVEDHAVHDDQNSSERRLSPETLRFRQRVLDALRTDSEQPRVPTANGAGGTWAPGNLKDRTGELSPEVQRVLNHELVPLIRDCYDQAKVHNPGLVGMLGINLHFAMEEDFGGIVEAVDPTPLNELPDQELVECIRQSAFSIQLPASSTSGRNQLVLTMHFGQSDQEQ